jgi:chromosome segregation ATPase
VEVTDITEAKLYVDGIITKYRAHASGEQFENNDYQSTYYLKIRVQANRLDSLVADLEAIDGNVINKSIQARDVTEEYIDLETRMTNKRSYLEQYRQLLKTSKTTEDILKVSERMREIEEELESVQGRLRYLSDQVTLSTLELQLYHTRDYVYKPDRRLDFLERFKESLSDGWYGFVSFLLLVVRLWPFALLLIGLLVLLRFKRRKPKPEQSKQD